MESSGKGGKNNINNLEENLEENKKLNAKINRIVAENSEDAAQKIVYLQNLVNEFILNENVSQLQHLTHIMLSEECGLALFTRSVLHEVCVSLKNLKNIQQRKTLAEFLMQKLKGRTVSFEEEDVLVREEYASCLISEGDYGGAARCLSAMNIEKSARHKTPEQKAEKYIQIAELYIKENDVCNADSFMGRASMCIHEARSPPLLFKYKKLMAQMFETKGKFVDAAIRYYELSQNLEQRDMVEEELNVYLQKCVNCAILSSGGLQRAKLFANLMKDERIRTMKNHEILQKMFLGILIKRSEIKNFADECECSEVSASDKQAVFLETAILQHNVLALSKLYSSIKLKNFSLILGVQPEQAEKIAAKMIEERRLRGTIDKRNSFIYFLPEESDKRGDTNRDIEAICSRINAIYESIPTSS